MTRIKEHESKSWKQLFPRRQQNATQSPVRTPKGIHIWKCGHVIYRRYGDIIKACTGKAVRGCACE